MSTSKFKVSNSDEYECLIPSKDNDRKSQRCSKLCKRIFPSGFKQETKKILEIAIPMIFTNLFRFLNPVISTIICGHLSKLEFDAVSMAINIINVLGVDIDLGFSTAFDTLFSQVYGAGQQKKMGYLLQRAMLVMTLIYLVLTCILLNFEPILILLRQDPLISEMSMRYLTLYLPGLFFDFQFLAISHYLQTQNIVYPTMISGLIGDIFSLVSQTVAIHVYGYGIEASAILQATSCFIMFAVQLGYVIISKVYEDSWDGWSWRVAFKNWKPIILLGIPGIFMVGLEEWNYEIGAFISGSLDAVQLGAHSIAFQYATISYMIPMGINIAMTIRAGQYLGNYNIDALKTSFRVCICIGAITAGTVATLLLVARNPLAALFTIDKDIQKLGSECLFLVAFIQISDMGNCLPSALIKATGRQNYGAAINFTCYYLFGIPLGLVLIFVFQWNIKGMWLGTLLASITQGIIYSLLIWKTDWRKECRKANKNAEGIIEDESESDIEWNVSNEQERLAYSDVENNSPYIPTPIQTHKRYYSMENIRFFMIEMSDDSTPETDRQLLLKRVPVFLIIICIFIGAILLRIFLPKSLYLPCISPTNFSINYYQFQPQFLCPSNITLP